MKRLTYLALIFTLLLSYQCESTLDPDEEEQTPGDEHPEMQIKPINIELSGVELDTLLYDNPYVWTIKIDSFETGYTADIDETWDTAFFAGITDISYKIKVDGDGMVIVYNKDDLIGGYANWATPDSSSFDNFKGEGNKYIAYYKCIYGHEGGDYQYGWISVNYSATGDTLKIIELATSKVYNVSVKAGIK